MTFLILFCAKYLIFVMIAGLIIYWLTLSNKRKVQMAVFGLITSVVAYALAKIGGALFYNPRPFVSDHLTPLLAHAADNGFPSSHTLLAAAIVAAAFYVSRKWGIVFLAAAIAVGGSRVLAHVHHLIDIIGSFVFVGLAAVLAYYVTPKLVGMIMATSLYKRFDTKTK